VLSPARETELVVPDTLSPAEREHRRVALAVLIVPWLGLVAACGLAWGWALRPADAAIALAMYALTMLGITGGYHRHFAHQSFKAHPAVRVGLGILGGMAVQGPLLYWVATHRRHHRYSDRPEDPHTPAPRGPGRRARWNGFWHAQVGWMLTPPGRDWARYVPDLLRDDTAFWLNRHYMAWVALGVAVPALVGGLVAGRVEGALTAALWAGPVRVLAAHHATWSINSVCHLWGRRAFQTPDSSTNHALCALLTLGEGWHNNHHAFPSSARHGLAWWQVDATYGVIAALARLGLVGQVLLPDPRALAERRPQDPASSEETP
jgi:stearoyl-CoA desaturase (delta-9 desaturase)